LIWIKASFAVSRHAPMGIAVLKTYTLYLRDGRDNDRFEPAMCASASEVVGRANTLLARNPDCEAIEVFFGDKMLIRVERPSSWSDG